MAGRHDYDRSTWPSIAVSPLGPRPVGELGDPPAVRRPAIASRSIPRSRSRHCTARRRRDRSPAAARCRCAAAHSSTSAQRSGQVCRDHPPSAAGENPPTARAAAERRHRDDQGGCRDSPRQSSARRKELAGTAPRLLVEHPGQGTPWLGRRLGPADRLAAGGSARRSRARRRRIVLTRISGAASSRRSARISSAALRAVAQEGRDPGELPVRALHREDRELDRQRCPVFARAGHREQRAVGIAARAPAP